MVTLMCIKYIPCIEIVDEDLPVDVRHLISPIISSASSLIITKELLYNGLLLFSVRPCKHPYHS